MMGLPLLRTSRHVCHGHRVYLSFRVYWARGRWHSLTYVPLCTRAERRTEDREDRTLQETADGGTGKSLARYPQATALFWSFLVVAGLDRLQLRLNRCEA